MPFFKIKNAVKNAALKKESNWLNKVVNVNNTLEETPCMPSDIKRWMTQNAKIAITHGQTELIKIIE